MLRNNYLYTVTHDRPVNPWPVKHNPELPPVTTTHLSPRTTHTEYRPQIWQAIVHMLLFSVDAFKMTSSITGCFRIVNLGKVNKIVFDTIFSAYYIWKIYLRLSCDMEKCTV